MTSTAFRIGANEPDAHTSVGPFTGTLAAESDRNEDAVGRVSDFPAPTQRVYRPGSIPGTLTGNQAPAVLGNDAALSASTKLGPGSPNYQDNELETGQAFGPDDMSRSPVPEAARNTRDDVTPVWAGLIVQPRAGSTSMDNTRDSMRQRTFLMRPFDKLISEHPDALGRILSPPPFAARPIQYAEPLAGAFPSAGGHEQSVGGGAGVYVQSQPNTVRLIPNAWDEQVLNNGGPAGFDAANVAVDRQRAAGWRA